MLLGRILNRKLLVSIIIPNYNGEETLGQCLDSCLSQGEEIVKEIIVVDDNSIDGSWNIINHYGDKYAKQIKIIRNISKGAQSARNLGFSISTGDFIQWLDSDDILGRNKIRNQLRQIQDNLTIVFGRWYSFKIRTSDPSNRRHIDWPIEMNPVDFLTQLWKEGAMVPNCSWLVPRILCEDVQWNDDFVINQDGMYFFDILMNVRSVRYVNNSICYYRVPGFENVSRNRSIDAFESLLNGYFHYERILERRDNEKVRIALGHNYSRFIYFTHPKCSKLIDNALRRIEHLGLDEAPCVGGCRFLLLCKLLGLNRALTLRAFLGKLDFCGGSEMTHD